MGSEKGDAANGHRNGRCRNWAQKRSVPKMGSEKRVVPKIGSGKVDTKNGLRKKSVGSEKGGAENMIRKGRCRKWAQKRVVPKMGLGKVGAENKIRKGRCQYWAQNMVVPKMDEKKGGAENIRSEKGGAEIGL